MLKFEKVEVSGLIVLFIGVALLAATFYSAYLFLVADVTILASVDLAELFGNALAPLIKAVIHILYLGIMGWIGSILTIRAVQLLKKDKDAASQFNANVEKKPNTIPQPQSTQPKTEAPTQVKDAKKAENPQQDSTTKQPVTPQQEVPEEKKPEKPLDTVAA